MCLFEIFCPPCLFFRSGVPARPRPAPPRPAQPRPAPCPVLPCPAMPCHALPCPCHALPCPALQLIWQAVWDFCNSPYLHRRSRVYWTDLGEFRLRRPRLVTGARKLLPCIPLVLHVLAASGLFKRPKNQVFNKRKNRKTWLALYFIDLKTFFQAFKC